MVESEGEQRFRSALNRRLKGSRVGVAVADTLTVDAFVEAAFRLFSPLAAMDFEACVKQGALFADDVMLSLVVWGRNEFRADVLELMAAADFGRMAASTEWVPRNAAYFRTLADGGVSPEYLRTALAVGVQDAKVIVGGARTGAPMEYLVTADAT